ncbi:hypothetical protein HY634_04545 [Candidatus Uhrbacteria bacterium]|nr:hypothetical protein [Candidatus Uhrbacteria bacterium]
MNRRMLFGGVALVVVAAAATTHTGIWDRFRGEWRCSRIEVEHSISSVSPDGTKWDIGRNGAPDPYGRLAIVRGGQTVASESVGRRVDTFSFTAPFFRKQGTTLHRDDVVSIRLFDEDLGDDDVIGTLDITVSGRSMSAATDNDAFSATVTCVE